MKIKEEEEEEEILNFFTIWHIRWHDLINFIHFGGILAVCNYIYTVPC